MEAQGLTFNEAMMARTPVVATRSGGIVDSVIDGVTGLLVDERAPSQIAEAVDLLMRDRELRSRLVDAAYVNTGQCFSRAASAQAFSDLFSDLTFLGRGA